MAGQSADAAYLPPVSADTTEEGAAVLFELPNEAKATLRAVPETLMLAPVSAH